MNKLCALSCVFGWCAFWAFSYLALMADPTEAVQSTVASVIAFGGFLTGMFSYMRLGRGHHI